MDKLGKSVRLDFWGTRGLNINSELSNAVGPAPSAVRALRNVLFVQLKIHLHETILLYDSFEGAKNG